MALLPCPYLDSEVDLTQERERHIAEQHPDLLPEHRHLIAEVIADPDQIRRSSRSTSARLFSRWFTDLRGGKHVVVVVISEDSPGPRHWVVTAYIARELAKGATEWQRS